MSPNPRCPVSTDFPSSLTLTISPASAPQVVNALILLHGLGDSHISFTQLARSLSLPYTVGLVLRGPNPIAPFLTGSDAPAFHWSDDLLFDERTGTIDGDAGFTCAINMIETVVKALVHKCGFKRRNIWFLGYGQGAMAGLGYIIRIKDQEQDHGEYGGVVAVGGRLPKEFLAWLPDTPLKKLKTPVLLCGGKRMSQVTKSVVSSFKDRFLDVRYAMWDKEGDGMPKNREEMLPVMHFFAQRLSIAVPEGAVEL